MINKIIDKLKLIFIPCEDNKYRPKFLEGNFLYYYLILLLVLKIILLPFFIYFPKSVFFADLTEVTLIKLTNNTREFLGLQPLKENPILNTAAYLKAKDMIEKDYFSHQSPEGFSSWYWFKKAGYNYQQAGENLAIGFLDSEEVHQAWLDSPSHKRNLLDPNYREIGLAVLRGDFQGNETTVVVQLLGTPKTQTTIEEKKEVPIVEIEKEPEKEIRKEEVLPKEEKVATETITIQPREIEKKNEIGLNFLSFLASDYHNLLQKIIYGSLIFIIISLFITILFDVFVYRAFEIQYKDIVLKAVAFSILLILLLFIGKGTIIQLIPHNFSIY